MQLASQRRLDDFELDTNMRAWSLLSVSTSAGRPNNSLFRAADANVMDDTDRKSRRKRANKLESKLVTRESRPSLPGLSWSSWVG